jgi:hypothetical protein
MFLIPAFGAFFTFLYLRPQEVFEALRPVTLVGVVAVVALGYVLDARLGISRLRASPLVTVACVLFGFGIVTILVRAPDRIGEQLILLAPPIIAFVFLSQGVQTLRALGVLAALIVTLTLVVAAVGVHQGTAQPICYLDGDAGGTDVETTDGRPCSVNADCREGGLPGRDYVCERPGLFNTHSVGGRVRFRGLLEDPNELSWAIAMGVPLALALYELRRSALRLAFLAILLVVGTTCIIMTKSRSGQLSLLAVLGVYFLRRFGWRGGIVAVLGSIPLALLGGRSGAEAESSSQERLECLSEALSMWRDYPILGVGQGQFTEHHFLTAHNSFMLTLAELGPLGLLIWSGAMYFAIKIAVRAQTDLRQRPETAPARTWALALLASLVGMLVSSFFLSIAYHAILWTFLGMAAALYGVVRAHEPTFRVRFGLRDVALVAGIDTAVVSAVAVYLRLKGI